MIVILWLFRLSVPADPLEPGLWLQMHAQKVGLAVNLVPFAGIAFLWFLGHFATAWDRKKIGSLQRSSSAALFCSWRCCSLPPRSLARSSSHHKHCLMNCPLGVFPLARAAAYGIINVYAVKMAAVFMFSTSHCRHLCELCPQMVGVFGLCTRRGAALRGGLLGWSLVVLPLWVFAVSGCLLRDVRTLIIIRHRNNEVR